MLAKVAGSFYLSSDCSCRLLWRLLLGTDKGHPFESIPAPPLSVRNPSFIRCLVTSFVDLKEIEAKALNKQSIDAQHFLLQQCLRENGRYYLSVFDNTVT